MAGIDELAARVMRALDFDGGLDKAVTQFYSNSLPIGKLLWTGFKAEISTNRIAGQWLLYPPDDWEGEKFYYYANIPHLAADEFKRGDSFDVGPDTAVETGLGERAVFTSREEVKENLLIGLTRLFEVVLKAEPPWIKPWLDEAESQMVKKPTD